MKSRPLTFRWILVITVLALVSAGVWYWTRQAPIAVTVARVETGTVEATVANTRAGTIKACRRARLAPSSGGQIARLRVHEGERVSVGQVLLELWNEDLSAQKKLTQQQYSISQARINEACVLAEQADREVERTRQLKARGFVSDAKLDQAQSEARSRAATCEAARADLGQSRERIAVASAGLERTQLRAPFAGIVAKVTGELGEFTTPSPPGIPTPPAIDLIDDSCLYVSAPIDEVDAPHVQAGMETRITLDAMTGQHFPGKVRRIAPYVLDLEKQARTVDVEVDFNDPAAAKGLLVGYSADVEIIHTRRDHVLRIPTPTLQEGGKVLLVRSSDNILEERQIQTGLSNWENTEVTGGLKEGDQLVMSLDRAGVKAGVRVTVEQASKVKK